MTQSGDTGRGLVTRADHLAQKLGEKVGVFWNGISNPLSVISMFIFALIVTFLGVGHYLFRLGLAEDADSSINYPVCFFIPCLILMLIYHASFGALFKHGRSKNQKFDGGFISTRMVLRAMAVLTAASFAVAGFEMLSWGGMPVYENALICWCGVPVTVVVFAIAHGSYANHSGDMLFGDERLGSGRRTLKQLILMTLSAFLYNFYFCFTAGEPVLIWFSIALLFAAPIICMDTWLIYDSQVSKDNDRGFKAS